MEVFRKFWFILIIGLALRLVVAGFSYHPDVKTAAISSAVFFNLGSLNFYQDSLKIREVEILDDLPLSYIALLPGHSLGRIFVNSEVEKTFIESTDKLFGKASFWLYLVYLKLPFIIFDLLLALLLVKIVSDQYKKQVLLLWIFNPVTIWATAAVGQFDILPALFITLACLFLRANEQSSSSNKLGWASFMLGLGGSIKAVPFLLIPLLLNHTSSWSNRVKLLLIAVIPYLLSILPYLSIEEFRRNALLAPQLSKSLYAQIPLSGGQSLLLVPLVLIVLYLIYFSKKRGFDDFLEFSFVILLSILALTHFHMQWFLWVMPLLIIWWLHNTDKSIKWAISIIFASWLLMLFLFENSLQVKLFTPLVPSLDQAMGLVDILSKDQAAILRNLAASAFAGATAFIAIKVVR